ncbi:MAG: DUF3122 domain-containing protein [Gloeocapsa sp. DLM2.Bin57]|nr:MAG: DUF3122 domain-containing protein [Gloeocapsa sp. DLM2.Bin57]
MKQLFLAFLLSVMIFLGINLSYAQPAEALLRQIEETPGQVLSQSRNSLKDSTGNAWQVVLFKRVKTGETETLHLRLVGFPDKTSFLHPQDLNITTSTGEVLTAKDILANKSPAANVGEYEFQEILSNLPESDSLELSLPLEKPVTISIPFPVVLEWLTLTE